MWRTFVDGVETILIRTVARPVRATPPRPLRPDPGVDLERFVLEPPLAGVDLLPPRPGGSRRGEFPSAAPTADGSGDRASYQLFAPPRPADRAVLLVPGWLASVRSWFVWLAGRMAADGAFVALLDLPAHFGRTPPEAKNGQRYFTGDRVLTAYYLRQTVSDARSLARALAAHSGLGPVVAVGSSLGAWTAGQVAAAGDADAAVLVTPAADPARILRASPLLADVRRALWEAGSDPEAMIQACAPLALARRPRPRRRAHILAGAYDRAIERAICEELAKSWQATLDFHPVGHMTPYVSPTFIAALRAAVRES